MLTWASDTLRAAGRRVTGPAVQRKTWNLSALFQLPTGNGPAWLKTTPRFAADEGSVIAAFARADPSLVPPVIGAGQRRVLLEHLPGEDCWDASPQIITSAVQRLAAAQAALAVQPASLPPGLPDRRTPAIAGQIRALLDGPVASELTTGEVAAARGLLSRFPLLDECGLPDTIVHGDFHPGNWRSDGRPPAIVDWADAHLGNPVLDGLRCRDFLPPGKRPAAARAWISTWAAHIPGSEPARAPHRRTAGPAHLRRALPGVPRRHRASRTGLPLRRSRGSHPCRTPQRHGSEIAVRLQPRWASRPRPAARAPDRKRLQRTQAVAQVAHQEPRRGGRAHPGQRPAPDPVAQGPGQHSPAHESPDVPGTRGRRPGLLAGPPAHAEPGPPW